MERNVLATKVKNYIEENYDGYVVEIREVQKVNGMKLAITARKEEARISPTVYADDLTDYEVSEIADMLINAKIPALKEYDDIEKIMSDKNEILKRVLPKLVNKEKNQNPDIVSFDLLNGLAIQYIIPIKINDQSASVTITESIRTNNNIGIIELEDAAVNNINDVKIMPMPNFLPELVNEILKDTSQMMIITNENMVYGANAILANGMEKRLKLMIGDFYLIPSSVHEWIAVPKILPADEIKKMINEVNRTILEPDEFLSDDLFQLENGRLTTV